MADTHVPFNAVAGNLGTPGALREQIEEWQRRSGSIGTDVGEDVPISVTPRSQLESAQQPQKPGETPLAGKRAIGLLNSEEPYDLIVKSQEVLSFVTASFANDWGSGMSQKDINGLFWVLDSVSGALGYAMEGMESEG